jgi:hypothetical protein
MVSDHNSEKHGKLIFASIVYPTKSSETNAMLLADSIRTFAGSLSRNPILYFTPKCPNQLSTAAKERLDSLNVVVIPFKVDSETLQFPLACDVFAAAAAESAVYSQTDLLAWLGTNTVVLHEPEAFLLPKEKNLGYRPVHHTIVGSRYDQAVDEFWTLVYHYCKVPQDRIFPMETHINGTRIRPYFNAGMLVTRPHKRLLQVWRNTFFDSYQKLPFQELYEKNDLYKIFIHQALLSGVILSKFETNELTELPSTYNYPLHLHTKDITDHRPSFIEEVATFRHESFYHDEEWIRKMPAKQQLKQWLAERIPLIQKHRRRPATARSQKT